MELKSNNRVFFQSATTWGGFYSYLTLIYVYSSGAMYILKGGKDRQRKPLDGSCIFKYEERAGERA